MTRGMIGANLRIITKVHVEHVRQYTSTKGVLHKATSRTVKREMKIPSRKRREYWYIGHYTPEGKHWCLLGSTWKREPVLSTVGLRDPRYESQYLPLISQVVSASPFERTHPEAERLLLDMGFPAKFAPEKLRHDMYSESYRQRKAREDAFYEEALKYAVN